MASKLVTDRDKSSRAVAASAETHADESAKGTAAELAPFLRSGEKMPDVALLMRLVARRLAADTAALVAADDAHERELADDAAPREARDEAAARLRSVLVDGRAAIDAAFGPAGLRKLLLDGAVPEDPSVLVTSGERVASALRDAEIKLPKPRRASMKLDRAALADEIAAELPALKKALAKVATEEREKEATLRAKQNALRKSDKSFGQGAALLAASFMFAGLEDLAAKVRPSGRRPGRTAAEEDDALSPEAPASPEPPLSLEGG
ncbi:hypothetical protein WME75_41520 [Sorangium sp. So ce1014]|uniref:hypothetical protein n=1 Tax=Sorangium sp. So ce1014 TaxID=3133326 RepID=UPI003F648D6C